MTTLPLWYYGTGAILLAASSYGLVRLNERIEGESQASWPPSFIPIAIAAIIGLALLLPRSIAPPLCLAFAGTLPMAWSDLKTHILWDDATMLTILATGAADLALGIAPQALAAALIVTGALMAVYLWTTIRIEPGEGPVDERRVTLFTMGRYRVIAGDQLIGIADIRMGVIIGFALAPIGIVWPILSLVLALAAFSIWHAVRREHAIPVGPIFTGALLVGAASAPLNAIWRLP